MEDFVPDALAIKAASDLADILADIAGRPFTQEERARCHQHVANLDAALASQMEQDAKEG